MGPTGALPQAVVNACTGWGAPCNICVWHHDLAAKSHLSAATVLLPCLQVPGDGRELVVMLPDAVKVSAEDGRRVEVGGRTA